MTVDELMDLRSRSDAPYNHEEYTVWLHNQIVDKKIRDDLWKLREEKGRLPGYVVLNHALSLAALEQAKFQRYEQE